jgi:hypothetical protein
VIRFESGGRDDRVIEAAPGRELGAGGRLDGRVGLCAATGLAAVIGPDSAVGLDGARGIGGALELEGPAGLDVDAAFAERCIRAARSSSSGIWW